MEKRIYDKKTGIHYELQGDYYLPCLTLPEQPKVEIGIWGQRHLRYIRQHKRLRYSNLLTSGKLNKYLADVDRQAEEMFSRIVEQMAEREGITEQFKADNQMEWVARMNNIRNRATEVVNHDIIYN
ncbi:MAG: TnpV protein [Butyrivibrio hungatei]|nr:TnpV protein [Butyrivibrio hungatei]